MRIRASLWVVDIAAAIVVASGCGGDDDSSAPSIPTGLTLEDSLRYAVPTPEEYSGLLEGDGNPPATVGTDYPRSNAELASELPGYLLSTSYDEVAIGQSGRETGYLAIYTAGTAHHCCTAEMAIELYENDAEAEKFLKIAPSYATSALHPDDIGDSAVAWLGGPEGQDPECPCELWFRVGPLIGAVLTTHSGPIPSGQGLNLEPAQRELALLMVERMHAVLASASRE